MAAELMKIPETTELATAIAPCLRRAEAVKIASIDDDAAAKRELAGLVGWERRVEDLLGDVIKDAHALHKKLTSRRAALLAPLQQARAILNGKISRWAADEYRRANEEQARLLAEATKKEAEMREIDAVMAEESGEAAEAEAIRQAPVIVPVPDVAPAVAQVAGIGSQTRYSADVTDLPSLILAVADRLRAGDASWVCYLEPSGANLNRAATSQREALNIPGVKLVKRVISTVRRETA